MNWIRDFLLKLGRKERVGCRGRVEERMRTECFFCSSDSFIVSTMYLITLSVYIYVYIFIYICWKQITSLSNFTEFHRISVFICIVSLSSFVHTKGYKVFGCSYVCLTQSLQA